MAKVRARKEMSFVEGAPASDPVVLFDIEGLNLEGDAFMEDLLPTFSNLEWDYYDVRREQNDLIRRLFAGEVPPKIESSLLEYYRGAISLDDLRKRIDALPDAINAPLLAVAPYRQRTTATLLVTRDGQKWQVDRIKKRGIKQDVAPTDYRSVERVFSETSNKVIEHPQFLELVRSISGLVGEVQSNVRQIEMVSWQTSITATAERPGSNSPEGIHQDGADYIVSALVLERQNIKGGESRIFGPDKTTQHVSLVLNAGQGIFQADKGSSLWHDVTPIRIENPQLGPGTRKLFGFDVNVVSTA